MTVTGTCNNASPSLLTDVTVKVKVTGAASYIDFATFESGADNSG